MCMCFWFENLCVLCLLKAVFLARVAGQMRIILRPPAMQIKKPRIIFAANIWIRKRFRWHPHLGVCEFEGFEAFFLCLSSRWRVCWLVSDVIWSEGQYGRMETPREEWDGWIMTAWFVQRESVCTFIVHKDSDTNMKRDRTGNRRMQICPDSLKKEFG